MAHRGCKETLNPLNKWLQSNCLICSLYYNLPSTVCCRTCRLS